MLQRVKPKRPLSPAWSAEDRLRVVASLLPGLSLDIYAGRYSEPGRPNVTSLQHIIYDPPDELERVRSDCETFVAKHEDVGAGQPGVERPLFR